MKKIISIVGARPNFIKLDAGLPQIIVHTGQHHDIDMSKSFFDELVLPPPKYNLGCNQNQLGKMILKLEGVLVKERPDLVIVYGDANSAAAGAVASYQQRIPVSHVEAGLRVFDKQMLEEHNRVISDHIACLNFCPTETAFYNLKKEGLDNGYLVGDVMIDRLVRHKDLFRKKGSKEYILLTCHRAEAVDNPNFMKKFIFALSEIKQKIFFLVHPRTKKRIKEFKLGLPKNVKGLKPLGYRETLKMINNARAVVTDSGGLQKEAYFLKKNCVIIRNETEWPEIVDNHSIFLIRPDEIEYLPNLLNKDFSDPKVEEGLFGNGRAWKKIKKILAEKGFL